MSKYIVSIVYPTTSKNSGWASYDNVDIDVEAIDFSDAERKALIKFSNMHPNAKGKVTSVNTNERRFLDDATFKNGGTMSTDNKEMLMNQAKELKHHADELMKVLKNAKDVEAWVVAKAERATTDLSDITHYLDGEADKYRNGGRLDVGRYYKTKDGKQFRYLGSAKDPEYGTFTNKTDGVSNIRYDEIEGHDSIFAHGGKVYVDLFEERDEMPYKVEVIVDKYEDEYGEDISYQALLDMQREVEEVGYTFDFGLDSMPYGLRPMGVDITQLRDYDDDNQYGDGGYMAKGGMIAIQKKGEKKVATIIHNGNVFFVEYYIDNPEIKHIQGDDVNTYFAVSDNQYSYGKTNKEYNAVTKKLINAIINNEVVYYEDGGIMAKGDATFKDKVKSISKRLDKTKVPLKYRKEYGKYFSKKEATQSAQRIVGSITK